MIFEGPRTRAGDRLGPLSYSTFKTERGGQAHPSTQLSKRSAAAHKLLTFKTERGGKLREGLYGSDSERHAPFPSHICN